MPYHLNFTSGSFGSSVSIALDENAARRQMNRRYPPLSEISAPA